MTTTLSERVRHLFAKELNICDPSRKKGACPNFTLWLFHGPGREIVKNYWNVSEISLSHREIFHAVKKVTVTVKIFHGVKTGRNV